MLCLDLGQWHYSCITHCILRKCNLSSRKKNKIQSQSCIKASPKLHWAMLSVQQWLRAETCESFIALPQPRLHKAAHAWWSAKNLKGKHYQKHMGGPQKCLLSHIEETAKHRTFLRGCMEDPYQSITVKGLVPSAAIVESWSVEYSLRNLATFWVAETSSLKN